MAIDTGMKMVLVFVLTFATVKVAKAESFVFETGRSRLVIGSDGVARSLINKQSQKEVLRPGPFAAVRKKGQLYAASAVARHGALFHVTFGTSGGSAD